ncbi:discoidin domain-containing protein [Gluconobacter cerinus]|uniref:discoidin domain-containing protein n=1 Tax=Gluconobacter cerinus TaxID=38307 RepID=UPI001B8D2BFC|nr:discoidin domain-containing protein [Gluconobacter cerinus]
MPDHKSRTLVALRTHNWNENVEYVARKLFGASANCDFVLIVDETNTVIDNDVFEKLSHNNDMSSLNLPHWPASYNNLHYNGDYVLYYLRQKKPDYDYYVMSENDTLVNTSIDAMIAYCTENDVDLVALIDEINSPPHADFHANSTRWYTSYGRAFFPFICATGRLIDSLYSGRLRIRQELTDETKWPYCESYVASHTLSNPEFKICDLSHFANLDRYTFMRHKYLHDGNLYLRDSIVHPVIGDDFYKRNLQFCPIEDIFDATSDLRGGLDYLHREKKHTFFPYVEDHIKKLGNIETLYRFYNLAVDCGWIDTVPEVSKAFLSNANQSSVWIYSTFQDPRKDAALVVDGIISEGTKSHTAIETNPWVEVEMQSIYEVRSVFIYVRPFNFHIFRDFQISFSEDGERYEVMYCKNDGCVPDSANLKPIIINFGRGHFAKFVRVTLLGHESMALNQIEVFSY